MERLPWIQHCRGSRLEQGVINMGYIIGIQRGWKQVQIRLITKAIYMKKNLPAAYDFLEKYKKEVLG